MLKITLEVVLISVGVFLALMGEQWRESSHTREVAEASLRGFRAEILANQKAVAAVKDYHVGLLESLRKHLAADPKTRNRDDVQIRGLQPVFFEHTAWTSLWRRSHSPISTRKWHLRSLVLTVCSGRMQNRRGASCRPSTCVL